MYRKRQKNQIVMFEELTDFSFSRLNPKNRWIQMSNIIPWDLIEEKYSKNFAQAKASKPAKPARMALGSHIIKEKLKLSDEGTVQAILESPYLQYFIGLHEFATKPPFDSSTMCWFRKRLTPEMISEVNDYIIGRKKIKDKHDDKDKPSGGSNEESKNKGTLILDATCAPVDISFPTDTALLNESREKLEEIIDVLHKKGITGGKKPRTYRRKARKQYLRFARNRKPKKKDIKKAIKSQLSYVKRDLKHIDKLLAARDDKKILSKKHADYLAIIRTLYGQQAKMYKEKKHSIEKRIVSLHQPWVRPIVRGKASAPVEFGPKISISMQEGYAKIERLDWEAYNESTTLIETVENYYKETGFYPERILGDKIYRTRENHKYCTGKGIHLNGPRLGRPPKDKVLYRQQCKLEHQEAGERNAVEGKFGEGKRTYNLGLIRMRLKETSETTVHLVFLVMNLEKRLRAFLRLFWNSIFRNIFWGLSRA